MLVWRNKHAQLFCYTKDGTAHSRQHPSYGLGLKLSGKAVGRPTVRHFSLGVYVPTRRVGRGCWTAEALTWLTDGHGAKAERLTLKTFVRVKVGLGGKRPARKPEPQVDPALELRQRQNRLTRDFAEVRELARVEKKRNRRQVAQQQKGSNVRRGLNGKALPNSRRPLKGGIERPT